MQKTHSHARLPPYGPLETSRILKVGHYVLHAHKDALMWMRGFL
jgi:hypothetical protein